jgi:hypothetical protein
MSEKESNKEYLNQPEKKFAGIMIYSSIITLNINGLNFPI